MDRRRGEPRTGAIRASGRSGLIALILLVGLAVTSRAAFAADDTVIVNTLDEEVDTNQKCSLREAIDNINDQAPTHPDCTDGNGRDLIYFSEPGTIKLTSGPLSLGGQEPSLIIDGSNTITLDGGGATRIFIVNTVVVLRHLTITNGFTGDSGGAAYVSAELSATDCFFVGNKASVLGGAIDASGQETPICQLHLR